MDQRTPSTTYEDPRPVAFVKAGWHADIVDRAHDGFVEEMARLTSARIRVDAFEVPGAFEIPMLAKDLAESGRHAAVIGAGFVVDGGIYRHDFVAATVVDALMRVQLDTGVPVFSVVLTPHNYQETNEHERFFREHFGVKGVEAARACERMLAVRSAVRAAA